MIVIVNDVYYKFETYLYDYLVSVNSRKNGIFLKPIINSTGHYYVEPATRMDSVIAYFKLKKLEIMEV
jgi:hypothetical protein